MSDVPSPPPARPAASLMLLRDGDAGLEVLLGRRAATLRAFPGTLTFPGGKIEPADRLAGGDADDPLAPARVAALREMFEEAGLFLSEDGSGAPGDADLARARRHLEEGRLTLAALTARWTRGLGLRRLAAVSHWITPEDAPYRFDTWFFVAAASPIEGSSALAPGAEFVELRWARPADILASEGERLMRPTRANLERLAESRTAAEAVAKARASQPVLGRPRTILRP